MSVNCPKCGTSNADQNQFCSQCGSKLLSELETTITFAGPVELEEDFKIELDRLDREGPVLVIVKGTAVGRTFQVAPGQTLIGRDPGSDIFLDDITVSRKHAEIKREQGKLVIIDIGSLNGTYLNRQRVEKAYLANRDEIQIGKFKMIFLDDSGDGDGAAKK